MRKSHLCLGRYPSENSVLRPREETVFRNRCGQRVGEVEYANIENSHLELTSPW